MNTNSDLATASASLDPCAGARAELRQFAEFTRRAIEPGLQQGSEGTPITTGACLHAAVLLAGTLNKFGLAQARIRGGDGDLKEGIKSSDGTWCGHYWVEVTSCAGEVLWLDITADQFGHAEVLVLQAENAARLYRAGRQDLVDGAAMSLAKDLWCIDLLTVGD